MLRLYPLCRAVSLHCALLRFLCCSTSQASHLIDGLPYSRGFSLALRCRQTGGSTSSSVELGLYLNLLSITHPATLRVRHSLAWPFGFNIVVLVGDYLSSYADERSDPTLHPCNTLRPHAGGIGGIFGVVLDKRRALDASMLCTYICCLRVACIHRI